MTAPRLTSTPSLDDLAQQYGVTAVPSGSLDDLARQYGVSGADTGSGVTPPRARTTDDEAHALLNTMARGGVAPIRSDATRVAPTLPSGPNVGRSSSALASLFTPSAPPASSSRLSALGEALRRSRPPALAPSDATRQRPAGPLPHVYSPSDALADVKEGASQIAEGVRHPLNTAASVASQAVRAALETFNTPVIGQRVSANDYLRGKVGPAANALPIGTFITKENTPSAITPEEFARSGLNTVANVGLAAVPGGTLTRLGANAALGAINDPDKPLRGAVASAGLGELLHHAATKGPAAVEAVKAQFADHPLSKIVPAIPEAHAKAAESALTANGPQQSQNGPQRGPQNGVETLAGALGRTSDAPTPPEGATGRHAIQAPTVAQGAAPSTAASRVVDLPTSAIARDPARFQFKQNVDEQGVGRELKSVETYNPMLAGVLSVWRDPADGRTYIINGHHRLELAERTGHPTVTAQYLDAATPAEARAQGALVNIAEGRGTPLDAAQFFRDSKLGPDDLKAQGISLSGAIAKNGLALSKLDPAVFDKVARGQLAESHGALIGTLLDRPEQQIAAAQLVADAPRTPTSAEVAEIAKQVRAAGSMDATQESMFGAEQFARSLIHERAQVAAELQRRLAADKRLFTYVGQEGRASDLARAGNTINVDASQQLGAQSAALLEGFSREAYAAGPVGRMITEAAQRVANGEKAKAVAGELYPAIRDAVHAALTGRGATHGSALEARGGVGEPPARPDATGRQAPDVEAPDAVAGESGRVLDSTDPAQDALFAPARGGRGPLGAPSLDDLAAHYGVADGPIHSTGFLRGDPELRDAYLAELTGAGRRGRTISEGEGAQPIRELAPGVTLLGNAERGRYYLGERQPDGTYIERGTASITPTGKLEHIAVHPDLQRRGFAQAMLAQAERDGHPIQPEANQGGSISDEGAAAMNRYFRSRATPSDLRQAYADGQRVGNTRGSLVDPARTKRNPYRPDSPLHAEWERGFADAYHPLDVGSGLPDGVQLTPRGELRHTDADRAAAARSSSDSYAADRLIDDTRPGRTERAPTLDELARQYDVEDDAGSSRRPLAAPSRDLFGNVVDDGTDAQGGLFNDRAGTESSRSLKETEAAARAELASLRDHLALVKDAGERQRIAGRIATLEKLVNRDRAIAPDELATRAAAERGAASTPSSGSTARTPAIEDGTTQGVLLSPASQPTPTGATWRKALGLSAPQTERVVALRKISAQLADAVGVPLHEGRGNLTRMRALGAFWPSAEVVRVRRLNNVATVAHEIGHFMSKTEGIKDLLKLTTKADRVAMRAELVAAGRRLYGNRKPTGGYAEEGIAEWAKFRITDPARMQAEFPHFGPFAETILERNGGLKVAMDKAQADFARYTASPANARVRSMISTALPSRFAVTPRDIVDYAFDDLAPLRRASDALGVTGDPNRDAYTLARLTKGNPGRAKDMVDNGVVDFTDATRRLTRGIPAILHDVAKDREAFTEYFVARQVLTKTAQGIDTGFDVPAAREVVAAGDQNPAFVKAADELWDYRQKLLKMRVDAGLLTPQEYDAIVKRNPTPTPFYRDLSDANGKNVRGTRGLAKNSSGVHTLKGSSRPILDPIESIISDAYETVDAAHKHYAASVLIRTALATDGGGKVAELLPEPPQTRVAIPMGRAAEQLIDAGWTPPDPANAPLANGAALGMLEAYYQKPALGGREVRDMVMPLLIDGERKWVQINDRAVWDAMQGMSKPELGIVGKLLGAPTRMLRLGATQFNPDFALTNPLRDAFDAGVYSQGPVRPPFYHLIRGLFHIGREKFGDGDTLYERWAQEGGGNAGLVGNDRRALRSEYAAVLREVQGNQTLAAAVLNRARHPISTAREFFETFENATRLGEFGLVRDRLMKQGMSEAEASRKAALASRDVTLDFSKAGRTIRTVNQFVPFLAAHMADVEKLAREHNPLNLRTSAGRGRMAAVVGRAAVYVTLPSVALYLAQRNDPDYQEVPESVKALAWVIVDHDHGPVPISLASGKRTRIWVIPRPHLLGFVYGYLPEKALAWLDKHDPHALDHTASQTVQAFTPPWVPTFAAPLIEAWSNKSTFTGQPIIPQSVQGLAKPDQVQTHTGELARLLGRYTNQSPAMIEQVARDYTGGAGMGVNDLANVGIRATRDRMGLPPLAPGNLPPDDPLKRVPVLRRFVMDRPGSGAASVQDLRAHIADAATAHDTWRRYLAEGNTQAASIYFAKHRDEIAAMATREDAGTPGPLAQLNTAMLEVQHALNQVRTSTTLPPIQKAMQQRALEDRLIQLARTYTHPAGGAAR